MVSVVGKLIREVSEAATLGEVHRHLFVETADFNIADGLFKLKAARGLNHVGVLIDESWVVAEVKVARLHIVVDFLADESMLISVAMWDIDDVILLFTDLDIDFERSISVSKHVIVVLFIII